MFCTRCGTQVPPNAPFCSNCGQPLATAPPNPGYAPPPPAWTPPATVHVTAGRWIGMGWDLVKTDIGGYMLLSLVFFMLSSVPLIQGALHAGFGIHTIKKLSGRRADFSDFFKGFNFFIPTLVASLIIGVFTFAGALACLVGAIVVTAMFQFTYLFIVDKKMDFWPAMQASHAVVKANYLGFSLFIILAALVNVLGFCCLIVGMLITAPVTYAATVIAYRELVGFDPRTADL